MHFQSVVRADAAIAPHSQSRQPKIVDPVPGESQLDAGIKKSVMMWTVCEPLLFGIGGPNSKYRGARSVLNSICPSWRSFHCLDFG